MMNWPAKLWKKSGSPWRAKPYHLLLPTLWATFILILDAHLEAGLLSGAGSLAWEGLFGLHPSVVPFTGGAPGPSAETSTQDFANHPQKIIGYAGLLILFAGGLISWLAAHACLRPSSGPAGWGGGSLPSGTAGAGGGTVSSRGGATGWGGDAALSGALFPAEPSVWRVRLRALLALLPAYLLLGAGGYSFSDDAVRHELDGAYIAAGLPLYCLSPDELGLPGHTLMPDDGGGPMALQLPDRMPNHPHLATIYLPGTQLLAFLGALGPGYRAIFAVSACILMLSILVLLTPGTGWRGRGMAFTAYPPLFHSLMTLFGHPFWLILYFSGHSDVTAILLCLLALALVMRYPAGSGPLPGAVEKRSRFEGKGHLFGTRWPGRARVGGIGLAGVLWALACSMKPEAILVGLILLPVLLDGCRVGSSILLQESRGAPPEPGGVQNVPAPSEATPSALDAGPGRTWPLSLVFFLTGCLMITVPLVHFTLFDLFHLPGWSALKDFSTSEGSSLELECFFYTAGIYSDQFLSYRPDAIWLSGAGLSSAEIIELVRRLWLPGWAVLGLLLVSGVLRGFPGGEGLWLRWLFIYLLCGYFLYRGSWQPWYFVWFLFGLWSFSPFGNPDMQIQFLFSPTDSGSPSLNKRGSVRHSFLLSLLVLFYLPVVDYRVDGSFDLSFFYTGLLLAIGGGWLWIRRSAASR